MQQCVPSRSIGALLDRWKSSSSSFVSEKSCSIGGDKDLGRDDKEGKISEYKERRDDDIALTKISRDKEEVTNKNNMDSDYKSTPPVDLVDIKANASTDTDEDGDLKMELATLTSLYLMQERRISELEKIKKRNSMEDISELKRREELLQRLESDVKKENKKIWKLEKYIRILETFKLQPSSYDIEGHPDRTTIDSDTFTHSLFPSKCKMEYEGLCLQLRRELRNKEKREMRKRDTDKTISETSILIRRKEREIKELEKELEEETRRTKEECIHLSNKEGPSRISLLQPVLDKQAYLSYLESANTQVNHIFSTLKKEIDEISQYMKEEERLLERVNREFSLLHHIQKAL